MTATNAQQSTVTDRILAALRSVEQEDVEVIGIVLGQEAWTELHATVETTATTATATATDATFMGLPVCVSAHVDASGEHGTHEGQPVERA